MAIVHVRDAMQPGVVSCAPGTSLRDAARLMTQANVRTLVIMESGCGISGIVTTGDLVKATIRGADSTAQTDLAIGEIMTTEVLTVSPDESITAAAKRMIHLNVHRLVVVDGAGETCTPIGILSMGDIVRGMSQP